MPKKPDPIDFPTRRSVEALFRSISPCYGPGHLKKFKTLNDKLEKLKAKLLDNPEVRCLEAELDDMRVRYSDHRDAVQIQLDHARRLYQANGLTMEVRKEIDKLVAMAQEAEEGI